MKQVSYRIIAIYVIPVFLLVCILPWQDAKVEESVFAIALSKYGFEWAGNLFLLVVLTAAVSCSNSGLYATSRCIFALSKEGMAPAWLGRVNARGVPYNARENLCRKCEDRAGIVRKTDTNTPPGEDERGRLRV